MRALKILVVAMGVLIVAGTVTLVVLLVQRAGGGGRAVSPTGAVSLDLPEGTRILGVAGAGDRFAVHVEGPGGGRVLLLDGRGRLVGEVWPQRAPQPAR